MSDNSPKTLCAYVEEELQVKDPKAYTALISPATPLLQRLRQKRGKTRKRL